ncbi:hypothetical protein JV07_22950 [Salmonella enterica]|uniref:hypothetical protein n=2 Tax=Gammaproteobacteria TaxID=1236 RepID=UPI0012821F2F|nr:hypothetical protein [Salmonella enterica]EBY7443675.1 hypothetical protein [Salmonella enterica subsp. enterica serovar Infantis]ECF6891749.1 hypothetical protein [Salmonella enterica subsp. enterica serovar Meleagridis]EDB6169272.1 hypothetical protein [Salmonella enterica subsp. enterica serovar Corvallis]EDM4521036.1 hypothetical protein [Salmonella enterica subsp. enterica serovar Schwarzengrund]EGI2589189.1 hypothetical protein [Salmonella enterica subsp. enterica serovar Kiambu]
MMNRTEQARMAIQSRKDAEAQEPQPEVEITATTSNVEVDYGSLLGYVWKNRTDLSRKEKIIFRHSLPFNDNKTLIVEEGINSYSLYGDENFTCQQVNMFIDYFGSKLKKWDCFKPESYNDEFLYFFFKECILRNLPVAVSIFNVDQKKQLEVIKDVLNDIQNEYGNTAPNNLSKIYIENYVYNWKRNLKAIA